MTYQVEVAPEARDDLRDVFRFLRDSYIGFGDDIMSAKRKAADRVRGIGQEINALADVPKQGTLDTALGPGIRHVTKNRAVLYFAVNDDVATVRVLAVYFGSQDHAAKIRKRLT